MSTRQRIRAVQGLFVLLAMFCLLALVGAFSPGATVTWNANPPEEDVTNYRVRLGSASQQPRTFVDVGTNTRAVIPNEPAFVSVTAMNEAGESAPMLEFFFVPSPTNRSVRLQLLARDEATGRENVVGEIPWTATNATQFFRLAIKP